MLDVIRVGTVATGRDGLNEVVVLIFFLHLIVADEHLRIDSGRVGAGLAFCRKGHLIGGILLALEVGKETEFVERSVLIQVVELAGDLLLSVTDNGCCDWAPSSFQRDDYGHVGTRCL